MALATDALRVAAKQEVGYVVAPWRVAIQQEVQDLLRLVTTLAEQRGLTYFAVNGTLLGATKFQGMIPWDDDADLGITLEEAGKWQAALTTALINTPYVLTPCTYGWIVSGPRKGMLDLLVFAPHPQDGNYRLAYPLSAGIPSFWSSVINTYDLIPSELYPLRRYRYDDLLLWGPADGIAVSQRAYGADVYQVNRRPDGGRGIHPYWPSIARQLHHISQGCADFLGQHCPTLIRKMTVVRPRRV